jgi:hypothetical protein
MSKSGGEGFVLAMRVRKTSERPMGHLAVGNVATQIGQSYKEPRGSGVLGQHCHRDLEVRGTGGTDVAQATSGVSVVAPNILAKLPGAFEIEGLPADSVGIQKSQARHHTVHQESRDMGLPIRVMVHANTWHTQGRP